ncbi:MAG: hypothetical protein ACYTF1_26355 [Planctomycetota bacterium]|jgi:hypothetical protein
MPFLIAMIAVKAFSTFMQAREQSRRLAYQEAQEKYNAQIAEMDAKATRRKLEFEQLRQRREAELKMGALRAKQGAMGARTDVGAPLAIRAQQWAELELENFIIGLEGRTQESKFKSEAAMRRMQAKYYGKAAKRSILTGILGAGAAVGQGYMAGVSGGYWGGGGTSTPTFGSATATRGAGRF